MSNRNLLMLMGAVAVLVAGAIAGTWQVAQGELRSRDLQDILQPIAALVADDQKILADIKSEGVANSDSVLLENYLAQIRKDTVPVHAALKQRIDALANNNAAIVTLLDRYTPRARTSAFRSAAGKFRDYATDFRDRWQSLFEIFMAGGHLPAAGPAFPTTFADALAAESSAVQ